MAAKARRLEFAGVVEPVDHLPSVRGCAGLARVWGEMLLRGYKPGSGYRGGVAAGLVFACFRAGGQARRAGERMAAWAYRSPGASALDCAARRCLSRRGHKFTLQALVCCPTSHDNDTPKPQPINPHKHTTKNARTLARPTPLPPPRDSSGTVLHAHILHVCRASPSSCAAGVGSSMPTRGDALHDGTEQDRAWQTGTQPAAARW